MTATGTIVRKAGRPRKIKDEVVIQPEAVQEVTTIKKEESPKGNFVQGIRGGKQAIFAFRGNEYLKEGENHYFVNGNPAMGYKLIRVYMGVRGRPHRALEITLKPNKRTDRGYRDKETVKKLKAIGVSGIL